MFAASPRASPGNVSLSLSLSLSSSLPPSLSLSLSLSCVCVWMITLGVLTSLSPPALTNYYSQSTVGTLIQPHTYSLSVYRSPWQPYYQEVSNTWQYVNAVVSPWTPLSQSAVGHVSFLYSAMFPFCMVPCFIES